MNALSSVEASAHAGESEIARALTRAAIYRLLGSAFAHPSPSTVAAVAEAAELAARAAGLVVAAKLRELATAARASGPDEVARAYVSALERPGGCSPYEGSYGAAPLLAGKGAAPTDIAFGMTPGAAEVEDHIAAELEFMSVLALKEAAALVEGVAEHVEVTRNAETAFLRDHLGRWGGAFAEALPAITTVMYFTKASELLTAWLAADMSHLGVEVALLAAGQTVDPEEARPFTCPIAATETEDR
jgi:putative dimethyl sulfoxide reductase chaperone